MTYPAFDGFSARVSKDWNGAIIGTVVSVTNWQGAGNFPDSSTGAEIGYGAAYGVTLAGTPAPGLPHATIQGRYYDAANSLSIFSGSSLTLEYPTQQGSHYLRGTTTYYVAPQGTGKPGLVLYGGAVDNGIALINSGNLNVNVGSLRVEDNGVGTTIVNSGVLTVASYMEIDGSGIGGTTIANSGLMDLNGAAQSNGAGGVAQLAINGIVTVNGGVGTQGIVMSDLVSTAPPGFEPTLGNEITGSYNGSGGVLVNNSTISGNGRIANTAIDHAGNFALQFRNGPNGVVDGSSGYISQSNPPGLGTGQYTVRQPGALYINLPNEDKAVINQGLIEATGAAGLVIEDTKVLNVYNGIGGTLAAFGYAAGSLGEVQLQLSDVIVQAGTLASSGNGIVIIANGNGTVLDGSTVGSITNNGKLFIGNGSSGVYATAFGALFNNGTIAIPTNSTLEVGRGGLTLDGNGYVNLSNIGVANQGGEITGSSANDPDVLLNTYNTIEGSGQIGEDIHPSGFGLTHIVNGYGGSIVGTDPTHQLTVQLGSSQDALGTLVNHGLLQGRSPGAEVGITQATGIGLDIQDTLITQIPSATFDAFGQDGVDGVSAANGINAVAELGFSKIVGGAVDALGFAEVNLYDSTLAGVTLTTTGAGVIQAIGGTSALDGTNGAVTNHGTVVVGSVQVNAASGIGELSLLGTIVNSGIIAVQGPGTLSAGYGGATLTGGGHVTLVAGPDSGFALLGGPNSGPAATLHNVDNTIAGAGVIGEVNLSVNQDASLLNFDNRAAGVIDANDPNNPLALTAPTIANAGLIEATAGAALEVGQYALPVTITNSGAGLVGAFGPGAHVDLAGGTIVGGLITASGGGIVQDLSGVNTLDGSTAGPLTLSAPLLDEQSGNGLTLAGTIVNTNTITLKQSTLNIGLGNATLAGGGTLLMQLDPAYGLGNVDGSSSTTQTTLVNLNNTIVGAGVLGIMLGQSPSLLTFDNAAGGLVDANNPSAGITIATGALVTNAGTMVANGGTLTIDDDLENSGIVAATGGGTVDLAGAVNATPSGEVVIAGNGTVIDRQGFVLNLVFQGAGTFIDPVAQNLNGFGRATGFSQGNAIDFTGLSFNPSFRPVVTQQSQPSGNFTTLFLTPDGNSADAPVSILFAGSYVAGNFALSADPNNDGGTLISFQIAPPANLALAASSSRLTNTTTDSQTPTITGTGQPGDSIALFDGSIQVGVASVAVDGTWTIATSTLALGGHSLTAREIDTQSNVVGTSAAFGVTVVTPPVNPVLGPLMTNTAGALDLDTVVDGQMTFQQIGALGPEWEFDGQGNFLGDGNPGFLIRNIGDVDPGTLDVGEIVNGQAQFTQIGGLGTEWQFEGNADFAGDGQTQFLIRNTGTVIGGAMFLGQVVNGTAQFTQIGGLGLEWQFDGTGDYLGDGRQDVLFRNVGDVDPGAVFVGEDNNGTAQFTQIGGLGTEWQFEGTGDFLGDGHTDILIRNIGNVIGGTLEVGEVQNGQLTFTDIGGIGPEWEFVASGNFIDSSKTDFLIRNTNADDGRLVVGSVANGTVQFTTVGGVGPEWNFHDGNVATRI